MHQTQVRALVAGVTKAMEVVHARGGSEEAKTEVGALEDAWARLTKHLAIGPAPETRVCPACGQEIMRAATLCGYCWTKSTAVDTIAPA
jgi:hypothetical protein